MARSASQRIDTLWDQKLEPDVRKFHARVARETLAAEQARGFDKQPLRFVDRRTSAPLESVRPFGIIEFVARSDIADAARWIFQKLYALSPIGSRPKSRRYIKSHLVFLNRTSVGYDIEAALKLYKPGDRIQIVNDKPYAKKIEGRGKSVRGAAIKPLSKQAPNGVYRSVYAAARRRFAKTIFLDFTYRKLDLDVTAMGYQGGGWQRKDGASTQHRRRRIRRPVVYPVINIYQSQAGREGSLT